MTITAAYRREATAKSLARIPLSTAFACGACKMVFDGAPGGVCRICGSRAVRSVSSLLLSPGERRAWLVLVNRKTQTWMDDVADVAIEEVPIG